MKAGFEPMGVESEPLTEPQIWSKLLSTSLEYLMVYRATSRSASLVLTFGWSMICFTLAQELS